MQPTIVGESRLFGPCRAPSGAEGIGVIVKRVLGFGSRQKRAIEVTEQPEYRGEVLVAEADAMAVHRPCADITVEGSVYSRIPAPAIRASVEVGPVRRGLKVHAERRFHVRDGEVRLIPQAADLMEQRLDYHNAYGGVLGGPGARKGRGRFGARARQEPDQKERAYPRNPAGRGFATRDTIAELDGLLAPSQEDAGDPMTADRFARVDHTDWLSAPTPGHFGPVSLAWFPRAHWLVGFDDEIRGRALREIDLGAMSATDRERPFGAVDPRALSCAAPGFGVRALPATVPIQLTGFRWGAGSLKLSVDARCPGARLRFPGAGSFDLASELKVVAIEADREEISLVWTAFQPTAARYPDEQLATIQLDVTWP